MRRFSTFLSLKEDIDRFLHTLVIKAINRCLLIRIDFFSVLTIEFWTISFLTFQRLQ